MPRPKFIYVVVVFLVPLLLGAGVLMVWYWTVRVEKRSLLPNYGEVPVFSLTTETNGAFTTRNLRGALTITDFIFTSCAGTCPTMTMKMGELQDTFRTVEAVRFLSISVDPATDSPAVLAKYARAHNAIPGRWTFLTGPKPVITALSKQGFHLGLDADDENAILHSEKFILIDDEGAIRGYYDSDNEEQMRALIADTRRLLRRLP